MTAWQARSVRRLISGSPVKKMGLKVEFTKRENGERTYRSSRRVTSSHPSVGEPSRSAVFFSDRRFSLVPRRRS